MTQQLSFAKGLFFGHVQSDLIHPFPRQSAEERDTTRMVVESFRAFADAHLDGGRFDQEHAVPAEVRRLLGESGFLGLTIPEEHGGAGLPFTAYCRVMEECNRYCASTAVIMGGHQSIGIKALLLHGTDRQQAAWLPKLATGEWMAAYALTEPQAGSDPASLQTTADEAVDGSHFVLNGQKIWCTNGGFAEFITVFAKTTEAGGGRRITCFVLTPDEMRHGFRRGAEEHKLGLRGSSTTQLFLDDVKVPVANVLGERGKGLRVALEVLNFGRASLAAGCVGSSKRIFEEAARHARERVQFGRPIAEFEMVQGKLAEMAADTYAMESAAYLTAAMASRGDEDFSVEAAACKVVATESHWRTVNHAVQVAGGIAYVRDYPYERFLRDARINMIFEGTNEILRHFIALSGLKAPREVVRTGKAPAWSGPSGLASRVHGDLRDDASRLDELASALGRSVLAALHEAGDEVEGREFVQERLADAAMSLFVGYAVASRLDGVMSQARTGRDAGEELTLGRKALRDAVARAQASLSALTTSDDALTTAVSRIATSHDFWPFPLIP